MPKGDALIIMLEKFFCSLRKSDVGAPAQLECFWVMHRRSQEKDGLKNICLLPKLTNLIFMKLAAHTDYPNVMFSTSTGSWRKIWACSLNFSGFSVVR